MRKTRFSFFERLAIIRNVPKMLRAKGLSFPLSAIWRPYFLNYLFRGILPETESEKCARSVATLMGNGVMSINEGREYISNFNKLLNAQNTYVAHAPGCEYQPRSAEHEQIDCSCNPQSEPTIENSNPTQNARNKQPHNYHRPQSERYAIIYLCIIAALWLVSLIVGIVFNWPANR